MSAKDKLQIAINYHAKGQIDLAAMSYRSVLEDAPANTTALLMLGIILLDQSEEDQATLLFERLLALEPDNPMALHNMGKLKQAEGQDREAVDLFERASLGKPDLAPIFNDWAVSLNRLGMRTQALDCLDQALAIDPEYGIAHDNRGLVLYDLRQYEEAAQAHFLALAKTPVGNTRDRIDILLHLAYAAIEINELAAAERACRAVMDMDDGNTDAVDQLAKVLDRQLRADEALALRNRLARNQGLVKAGNLASPKATILLLGGAGAGHVPTRYLFDPAHFATMSLTMLSPGEPDAPLGGIDFAELAACDMIFNCLGEVEMVGGHLDQFQALSRRLGKPVLNLPETVAKTGRDTVSTLFAPQAGLIVPYVRWATRAEVATLDGSRRVLVRPGGAHGGKDLALIDNPKAAQNYLAEVPFERFLLTDFYDFKGRGDWYRKYRFIFVDRKPFAYHLAVSDHWLVHYWRAEMGMSDWKKAEEEKFLTDWRQLFGPKAAAVVDQIAASLNLDYGGMDCALLSTGDVLLFEANASMLLHLDDAEAEFPYKHQAVPKIRDAITKMVLAKR